MSLFRFHPQEGYRDGVSSVRPLPAVLICFLRWLPAVLITSASWYLSDQPTIEYMPDFWNADKLVHLICFGGLSFWTAFGCRTRTFRKSWLPALMVSVYGIADEIHQGFTPGRSATVFDWIADTLGAVLGALAFVLAVRLLVKLAGRHVSQ